MFALLTLLSFLSIIANSQQLNKNGFTQTPILDVELTDAGFHRNIIYKVKFDLPLVEKECEYVIRQHLPASVYVSVDQLDDLQRLNKLDAIYPSFVDVEKPTEQSKDFEVFLKGSPKITDTIILPIHFRYHAPNKDQGSYVSVGINNPTMFIKCPRDEKHLMENELRIEPNTIYCLDARVPNIQQLSSWQSSDEWNETCNWKYVMLDLKLKSVLSAEIPVGNKNAYPLILYATIIISWIISLGIVFRTRHIPKILNELLEEKRITQRKQVEKQKFF